MRNPQDMFFMTFLHMFTSWPCILSLCLCFVYSLLSFSSFAIRFRGHCFVLSQTSRFSDQRSSILLHKLYKGFEVLVRLVLCKCKLFLGHLMYHFVMSFFSKNRLVWVQAPPRRLFFGILHTQVFLQLLR